MNPLLFICVKYYLKLISRDGIGASYQKRFLDIAINIMSFTVFSAGESLDMTRPLKR